MNYNEIIKLAETKRKKLYIKYKKTLFFKKLYKYYLDKYDILLLDLYTKYDKK